MYSNQQNTWCDDTNRGASQNHDVENDCYWRTCILFIYVNNNSFCVILIGSTYLEYFQWSSHLEVKALHLLNISSHHTAPAKASHSIYRSKSNGKINRNSLVLFHLFLEYLPHLCAHREGRNSIYSHISVVIIQFMLF